MDCNVILDLLPLYVDGCCSEESKTAVETHLEKCSLCKQACDDMRGEMGSSAEKITHAKSVRINQFKASVVQSVLLFLSFAVITLGVTLEAATPLGAENGNWAYMLIIPATAFMLSLANWYFVRFYKNRSVFSTCCAIATLGFAICGYIWAILHYGNFTSYIVSFGISVAFSAVLCVASKILSSFYAKTLGKD